VHGTNSTPPKHLQLKNYYSYLYKILNIAYQIVEKAFYKIKNLKLKPFYI